MEKGRILWELMLIGVYITLNIKQDLDSFSCLGRYKFNNLKESVAEQNYITKSESLIFFNLFNYFFLFSHKVFLRVEWP